ncbi:MAG: 23S rRNA (guanosine(2251)-2'-O)-methyltransferase RlmB [Deltaproteobacteria bacterium]|nr:23S rRNA (guanosine(2251)-2'-O)-methyltransferase RlmB [Deltaproteobacteria bacterium]
MQLTIYGTNTIREAIVSCKLQKTVYVSEKKQKSGFINKDLLNLIKEKKIEIEIKNNDIFIKEFGKEAFIKGIAATAHYNEKQYEELFGNKSKQLPFYLILDEVTDPQNLGSIIRTANCSGISGIILPKSNSIFITSSVAQVSQGALFYVDVARVTNIARVIDDLKKRGIWIIGMSNNSKDDIYSIDYNVPLAVVIGSEGKGLRRLTISKCEKIVKIPMVGNINSLNAGVSFAVMAYEIFRQRIYNK